MKKNFTLLLLLLCAYTLQAGTTKTADGWTATLSNDKVFIENKGQFDVQYKPADRKVLFAIQQSSKYIYFTDKGITYHFYNTIRNDERGDNWEEELKEKRDKYLRNLRKEEDPEKKEDEGKFNLAQEFIAFTWKDASPTVQLIASDTASDYHTYCMETPDKKNAYAIENIKGYHKLLYKNLYPGIDVEYSFAEGVSGFKYSVIVHPGADPSLVKMAYEKNREIEIGEDGNLEVHTSFGEIIEKAPLTFYNDNNSATIASHFTIKNGTVGFNLKNYDKTKTLVIDPWVQSPNFNTVWDCVWECEKDAAGNVYIIGGIMPMQLLKYSAAGTLQWTYTTPYDTSNSWLGTFATDNAGNSYVTAGSVAKIQKISTGGTLVWNNASPGGIFASTEFWNITFNCDQTKLVIGGTGNTLPPLPYIYQVDMATGNITSSLRVTSGAVFPTQEVRSITSANNARYYWLSHDSLGFIKENFGVCPAPSTPIFKAPNNYGLSYKCEDWRKDNSGIMAIRTYGSFIYTHKGSQLHKRSGTTGAIIGTVAVPGGGFANNQVQNSGIDIDDCGNIYVGSKNQVVKYDQNLTQLATYATTFNVYDVHVTTGGNIIACGSTGNAGSGARTGSIQFISAGACNTIAMVCCDANICQPPTFCSNSAPYTLTPSTPGGVWSGTGITNTSTGVFSPAVAGVGLHTVVYTLPCGSDSVQIAVSPCTSLSVCIENNGNLTASNGVAPYTWQQQVTTQNCNLCFPAVPPFVQPCSTPPGCAVNVTTWATYATGTTVAPPAAYPIQVVDGAGTVYSITSAAQLQPCTTCPTITVTASNQQNVTCPSTNNGSVTVSASGGTGAYTYTWSPNVSSTGTATNLSAGTYTVTAKDANNCSGTLTITITAPATPNITTASASPETCQGQNNASITSATATGGNGTYTWTYAPIATPGNTTAIPSFPVNNLTPGNYILTVTSGGCTDTFQINVPAGPVCCSVSLSATTTQPSCGQSNGSITITPTPAGTYNYSWSNSLPNQATQNNLASGQYSVTVTNSSNSTCSADTVINLSSSGGPTLTFSNQVNPTCAGGDGSITVSLSGGTAPYQVTVDTGGTPQTFTLPFAISQSIGNLPAGTITVTVLDGAGCQAVNSATLVAPANCCTFTISSAITQPGCGATNGSIALTATNGSGNYGYNWSGGQTTSGISNIGAGTYPVTITDNAYANCSIDTTFTLTNPNAPTLATSNLVNPTCAGNDGSVTVSLSGGQAPYQVTVDTGGGTPQTFTVPFAISQAIGNLPAGTITVSVTDAAGCSSTTTVTLTAPANCCTFKVSANITPPNCGVADGGIALTATNGSGNYSYSWAGGQTTSSISNVSAGVYPVTITDNAYTNCTIDTSFTLSNPNAPVINASTIVKETCPGSGDGTATINATGGTGSYTYNWSNGQTTVTAINLTAGSYNFTVTDASNCQATGIATVGSNFCCTLKTSAAGTNGSCGLNNASISVSIVTAGVTPYTYSLNGGTPQSSSNFTGLAAGAYTIITTDAGGCKDTTTVTILPSSNTLSLSVTTTNVTCNGGNDGTATATPTGGTAPITFVWSNAATTATITGLVPDIYTVTATDGSGCSGTASGSIIQPAPLTVSLGNDTSFCEGGTALLDAGTGFVSYAWSTGETTQAIAPTASGTYMVTVTNSVGCTASDVVLVTAYQSPVVDLGDDKTGYEGQHLALPVNITPAPFGTQGTYNWTPGTNLACTNCASNIALVSDTITYALLYTDVHGCSGADTVTVFALHGGLIFFPNAFTPGADGKNDIYLPLGDQVKFINWRIFNRIGEKVFESNSMVIGWDGTYKGAPAPPNVYVYTAEVTFMNGINQKYKGSITLLR